MLHHFTQTYLFFISRGNDYISAHVVDIGQKRTQEHGYVGGLKEK